MYINSVNLYKSVNFSGSDKKFIRLPLYEGLNQDIFEKRCEETPVINSRIKEDAKRQRVPFGINRDIMGLDEEYIKKVVETASRRYKLAASRTALMAKTAEKIFDEKYGKNNYVVVSIGTSPAGISKGLELMGHDVRYVPITNLENMYDYSFERCNEIPKLFDKDNKYKNFLDSIGLNKDEIKKDKRHYVVIDYTDTGTCLETVQNVAQNLLGIKSKNTHYLSINKELANYAESREHYSAPLQQEIKTYKSCYFERSFMECFAGIPHLNCNNLDEIDELLKQSKKTDDFKFEVLLYYYLNGGKDED